MDSADGIRHWQPRIAQSSDLKGLRRTLLASADEIGSALFELKKHRRETGKTLSRRRLDEWRLIGVDAQSAEIGSAGASRFASEHHLVLVRASDPPLRQRFTVAHEIGHYLLSHPERSLRLSKKQEEALCDEFASRLLVPRARLSEFFKQSDQAPTTDALLNACRLFEVGLQPMLLALREYLSPNDPIYIVASYRGHRLRPDVLDFRVDASASPGVLYVATDQRLVSMGLHELALQASRSNFGGTGAGSAQAVVVKLWDRERGRSGRARGPASWEFTKLRNGPLIVQVRPGELEKSWASGRKEA